MPWQVTSNPAARPKFVEAIEWFRRRVPITDAQYAALVLNAHEYAFWIAGIAQLDMVAQVQRSLERAVASGQSYAEWRAAIGTALERAWRRSDATPNNVGWRLETIFRTNVQRAYSHGRYEQVTDPVVLDARPFWLFDAIRDQRTTEECSELDGTILPAADPYWNDKIPPRHFNCRSGIRTLRASQAQRRGVTTSPPHVEQVPGFGAPPGPPHQPSAADYPPELWAAFEARRAAREGTP